MAATVLLIRHAAHGLQGRTMVGRMPGVHLSADGRRQAEMLADRLAGVPLGAIYSSPLERARETAAPIAARLGLELVEAAELDEFDFGDWTGRTLDELAGCERWRRFNAFRSGTRAPNGEHMLEAQARMVGLIERLRGGHPDGQVALVGHGDPIRSALAHYLGLHLDQMSRIEISPASLSVVAVGDDGAQVLLMNESAEWPRRLQASGPPAAP